jgi:S-adenosylmethionine synthetase
MSNFWALCPAFPPGVVAFGAARSTTEPPPQAIEEITMDEFRLFTSESVSPGHPDKVADQISDAVVDLVLSADSGAKTAIETMIGPGYLIIGGEVSSGKLNLEGVLHNALRKRVCELLDRLGYNHPSCGFNFRSCDFQMRISQQSEEIRRKVEQPDGSIGAGDQGLMFGYACDETPQLMPAPITFSHQLMALHARLLASGEFTELMPDAKAQVTARYNADEFDGIETIVLSSQHRLMDSFGEDCFKATVKNLIIDPVIPSKLRNKGCRVIINPGGSFVKGGPAADTGLTGRKIIVDTYGGSAPHGGGAFSGKDPSKVDRSAAYMARYIAKNIVAAGLARRCTLQLAYAIGCIQPVSLAVDAHDSSEYSNSELSAAVLALFDLSPAAIIKTLNLAAPCYLPTASNGHFGNPNFAWEQLDQVDKLRAYLTGIRS